MTSRDLKSAMMLGVVNSRLGKPFAVETGGPPVVSLSEN